MTEGQTAEIIRRFSEADVCAYVALGGAPPRPDELPEPLLGALFTYLLGVELPGPGANYLKQNTRYLRPAPLDAGIRAVVTVTRVRADKRLVDLSTVCSGPDGEIYCEGRALLIYAG